MSATKLILLILLLVSQTGCAEFQHPLSDRNQAKADPALNGIWLVDNLSTLYIARKNDHEHSVVLVTKTISGGLSVSEFSVYPVSLGNESYLNVACQGKRISNAWAFFKYSVNYNTLDLSLIDYKYLRAVVESKHLEGFIKNTKCEFFINPANYSPDLKDAGQAMGILALNSFMRTMCHESLEIPIVTASPENLRSFFGSSTNQQHFVSLDSPRQIVSW